jgi:hypothetical protein
MSLKPNNLITTDKLQPVSAVIDELNKNIPKQSKDPIKTYLNLIVEYYESPKNKKIEEDIKKHYSLHKKDINSKMSEIKNDFGEILGGIASVNLELLKKFYKNVPFNKGLLEYPRAANEPLKDYSIHVDDREYTISAKVSGTTSNTVKPQDIISLIEKSKVIRPERKKELQSSLEYNILKILQEENTVRGPAAALSYFKENASTDLKNKMNRYLTVNLIPSTNQFESEFKNISSNINVSKKTSNPYDGKAYANIIKSQQFKSYSATHNVDKIVNWADLVLFFEYVIQKSSQSQPKALDFGELFLDAIASQIHYVKLTIDSSGIPIFEAYATVQPQNISNFKASDIYIRSKSSKYKDGRYRLKDKIGIQT